MAAGGARGTMEAVAGKVLWDLRRVRWKLVLPRGGPPRGRLYFALREAEGAQAGDCARHTRALDHSRAQECRSQRPGEHHQGKKGRPRWAMGCGNGQGGLSQGDVCLLEQPSAASSVRVGHGRWCVGEGSTGEVSSRVWRRDCRGRKSCTPILS